MSQKKYQMKTTCPQCGCSAVSHLTPEEIRERYGNIPNVEIECNECRKKYETSMKEACPEWAEECKLS